MKALPLFILTLCLAGCLPANSEPITPADRDFVVPNEAPSELRVLSYNVFMRPDPISFGDETSCRARRIGQWLGDADLDVVALTETFRPRDVRTLSYLSRRNFPHQVLRQPAGGLFRFSGGLSLLSRWPIESTRTMAFDDCAGLMTDCAATKGALHAVLRVSKDRRLNVVATHLDAGTWDSDREARRGQLAQLRDFLGSIDPAVGPTILLGDFNIDALRDDGEYAELLAGLGLADAKVDQPSTINCKTSIWCEEPAPAERIDYVFTPAADKRLQREVTYHHAMEDPSCGSRYLSDHRAVFAGYLADW